MMSPELLRQIVRLVALLLAYLEEHPGDDRLESLINELALVAGVE